MAQGVPLKNLNTRVRDRIQRGIYIYLFIHGIVYLILFTYTHLRTHICRYVENVSSQMFRSGWPKFHNDKDMEISSYTQQQVPPATAWELVHVEYGN